MMSLEMCELCEALSAHIALEGTLARVGAQMHLQIRELPESLAANIALIMHLAIFLLERIRQRSVAP